MACFQTKASGSRGYRGGWGPMLHEQSAPLSQKPLVQRYPLNGLSDSIYLEVPFLAEPLIVSVDCWSPLYSHNLAAIINCDYEITHRPPRELLLPGCRTSRLIESQVSINYQGVLDCICSVPGHHVLPSYPPWPSSRADWSARGNQAKSPKLMLNGSHPIPG